MFDEDDSGAIDLDNDAELGETSELGEMTPEQDYDMAAIQMALKASRQMFGLVPPDEGEGTMPGFADGGAVEEDDEAIPLSDGPAPVQETPEVVTSQESAPTVQGDPGYDDLGDKPKPAIDLDARGEVTTAQGWKNFADTLREDAEQPMGHRLYNWAAEKVKAYLGSEGAPPPEKVDEAIAKAGTPEKAVTAAVKDGGPKEGAALMQGLRQRFDVNRQQAIEAYGDGKFADAASWATRMMHMAPNGEQVGFVARDNQFLVQTKEGSIAISPQEFTRIMRHSNFDHVMQDAQAIVKGRQPEEMKNAPAPARAAPAAPPAPKGSYSHFRAPQNLVALGVTQPLYEAAMQRFPSVAEASKRFDWMMGQLQQGEENTIAREKARNPLGVAQTRVQGALEQQNMRGTQQQNVQTLKGTQQQGLQTQKDQAAGQRNELTQQQKDMNSRRAAGVQLHNEMVKAGIRPAEIDKALAKKGLPSLQELQQPNRPQQSNGGTLGETRVGPDGSLRVRKSDGWHRVQ